jgi:hypothetical protein
LNAVEREQVSGGDPYNETMVNDCDDGTPIFEIQLPAVAPVGDRQADISALRADFLRYGEWSF